MLLMKLTLSLAVLAALAVPSMSGQDPEPPRESKPSVLDRLVGDWNRAVEFTMNGRTHRERGTSRGERTLGDRYVRLQATTVDGAVENLVFVGHDADRDRYSLVSLDSFSSTPLLIEGRYDAEAKTLRFTGQDELPWLDKPVATRLTYDLSTDDRVILRMAAELESGTWSELMVTTFERP